MEITIYNNGVAVAKSSKAFNVIETKELMRGWTLDFVIDNKNNVRKYINENAMFEINGQKFDIDSYFSTSGFEENATSVSAEHVSYRLNKYIIPPNYSFLGTAEEILQNLLITSGAIAEFSKGTVADLDSKAFSLGNTQEVTVRSALLGLQAIGVEVEFDNFSINLPARIGSETNKIIKYGYNLSGCRKTWSRLDGATYDVSVASLWRVPGSSAEELSLGDNVTVQDDTLSESFTKRIVKTIKCHDDSTKDNITLGVFIRDLATNALEMDVKVNSKLTEGEQYSKVSIDRINGFMAESEDGSLVTKMNAFDCFAVFVRQTDGTFKKVGYLSADGLAAGKLMTPDNDDDYGIIGKGPDNGDGYGLFLIKNGSTTKDIYFSILKNGANTKIKYEEALIIVDKETGITSFSCTESSARMEAGNVINRAGGSVECYSPSTYSDGYVLLSYNFGNGEDYNGVWVDENGTQILENGINIGFSGEIPASATIQVKNGIIISVT